MHEQPTGTLKWLKVRVCDNIHGWLVPKGRERLLKQGTIKTVSGVGVGHLAVCARETCSGASVPLNPPWSGSVSLNPPWCVLSVVFLGSRRSNAWAPAHAHCDAQPFIPPLSPDSQCSQALLTGLGSTAVSTHMQRSLMSASPSPFSGIQGHHRLWNSTYRSIVARFVFLALTFLSNSSCFPDISSWITKTLYV